jgi:iron complex transport system substrate-binding protein
MSNALIPRRSALSIGGLGLLMAGCSSASRTAAANSTASSSEAWSFTDDRGQRATTNKTPGRIVAYTGSAAALHDFGIASQVTGVFGPDDLAGQAAVAKLPSLGTAWGDFDIERYASLQPQLLVTNIYEDNELWYVPSGSADQIAQLAPEVGIKVAEVSLPEPTQRYASLAASLGADLSSAALQPSQLKSNPAWTALPAAARKVA